MVASVVEHNRPRLDDAVTAHLRALALRLRGYVLLEGIAWVIGFLFAAVVIQFTLDYGTRGLRWSMRAALLVMILAGAVWILWRRIISPLRVRVGLAETASLIERRFPELSSLLVSAVRFSLGEVGSAETNSPSLVASVVSSAGPRVRGLDFNTVLDPRRSQRAAYAAGGAMVVTLIAALAMPGVTRLWFARNVLLQNVDWPRRTTLVVDLPHGELIGARGDDLMVQASAEGVQPREVEIVFTTASGERGRETMVTVGSEGAYRYRYTFKNAQEDFVFHLEGGDDETQDYSARLLERPRVEWSQLGIVPPAYTRLEAFTLRDGERAAQVLPGSEVTFTIATNKPVAQATLIAGNKTIAPAIAEGKRHVVTIFPKDTQTYYFSLVDSFGLEDKQPVRFAVRVIKDEPPRVRMKLPGVGEMVTPEAILPIELEFSDAYGLAGAELVFQVSREDSREGSIPLTTFRPYLTTFSASLTWPLSSEAVTPGDRLTLFARATDFDDISGPNSAESPPISARVVTHDELLAELARREQEFRMDFERLIDAQEQLRSRLLTLIGLSKLEGGSEEFTATIATLERRQRSIAGSVNVVRQQVEQVLTEHRINQLASLTVEERLGQGIAEPLGRLTTRDLPEAADTIRRWSHDPDGEVGTTVDPQQVALLSQMRAILANMLQWEGYQEAINMLRDILRLQNEIRTETKDAAQKRAVGYSMTRGLTQSAILFVLWAVVSSASSAEPADTAAAHAVHPLASKEEMIRDRFQRFQDRVFRLREQLAEKEPENAARLGQALTRAGELGLSDRLDEIIALLRDSSALDGAIDAQGKWLEDADRLLSLLLQQDSKNEERKRELERLQAYKEKLSQLLEQERSLRAGSAQLGASERMAAQLDQAIRRLDALLERQGQVSKATQGGAASAESKTAEQQQDLSRDTEQLAEDIARLGEPPAEASQDSPAMESARAGAQSAAQSTQSGSQAMSQAGEQMKAGSPSSAGQQQKQAEKSLRDAKAQLEAAKQALKQQPSSPQMGEQQKAVAQQTQGLGDQMRQDAASSSGGKQGQSGKSGSKSPGLQNVDKAQKEMEGASESLDASKPEDATPKQDKAVAELEEAKRELEEALEQIRKEEREETLRDLEARFRDMLTKQRPINEATLTLDQIGRENFKRAEQLQLADLATNERALAQQASTCLHILDEEGTTVAFPRVVDQLAQDMSTAADRLAAAEVGPVTQTIEQEIVDTLEELLEAVKKMQQGNEQQQQAGKSEGGGEPPLLPASAELKLLKLSQKRINTRTSTITESAAAGREAPDAAARGLKGLAVRQVECSQIAKQMRDRQ